eukprot:GCRY01003032.1.p1 GENE.GCRY01003032.1~~GCRY01003032.1.p1  ORF type:complete len:390 (+),score=70.95 GCRY01003032.1:113-1282(+)
MSDPSVQSLFSKKKKKKPFKVVNAKAPQHSSESKPAEKQVHKPAQKIDYSALRKTNNALNSLSLHDDGHSDLPGLHNQGATCYLSSVIQALYATEPFRNNILTLSSSHDSQPVIALKQLFESFQKMKGDALETKAFTESMNWVEDSFLESDAQEFLQALFAEIDGDASGGARLCAPFYGKMEDVTQCLECGCERCREEVFTSLALPLRAADGRHFRTLAAGVDAYIAPEILDGDNCVHCDVCKKKTSVSKGIRITAFPDVLVVSLNRFHFDFQLGRKMKVLDYMAFDEEMDVAPFVFPCSELESDLYALKSVLVHRGTLDNGHYFAYVNTDGQWYRADDAYTTTLKGSAVFTALTNSFGGIHDGLIEGVEGDSAVAYMLFYQRTRQPSP